MHDPDGLTPRERLAYESMRVAEFRAKVVAGAAENAEWRKKIAKLERDGVAVAKLAGLRQTLAQAEADHSIMVDDLRQLEEALRDLENVVLGAESKNN